MPRLLFIVGIVVRLAGSLLKSKRQSFIIPITALRQSIKDIVIN